MEKNKRKKTQSCLYKDKQIERVGMEGTEKEGVHVENTDYDILTEFIKIFYFKEHKLTSTSRNLVN